MLKKFFYYRQHPDAALRYLPVVQLLKKEKLAKSQILEVGSGSYGITPYLKKQVTGVDVSFDEPKHPLLKQVKGSATKLPFKKNQFAVVVLSDVIEHVPKNIRQQCLEEAIRVARKAVIVIGPFGKQSAAQDKKLAEYSQKKLGSMHPFFKDHLEFGLPEESDIYKLLAQNKKVKLIQIIGRYLNLRVRERLMQFFISNNKLSYLFYLKGLMPLIPLLQRMNKKPCYRTLFLIRLT